MLVKKVFQFYFFLQNKSSFRLITRLPSYNIYSFNHRFYSQNMGILNVYYTKSNLQHLNLASKIMKWLNSKLSCGTSVNEVQNLADTILPSDSDADQSETRNELIQMLNFLLQQGCSIKDIKEKFVYNSPITHGSTKMRYLVNIDSDILSLLPLLSVSVTGLRIASRQANKDKYEIKDFPSRMAYLCHHLEINKVDLILALSKHSALLTMDFKRLDHKMNILKSAGIDAEYIVKDLWIFNYNEMLLISRTKRAQEAGVELKPWMLRSSEKVFKSVLLKYSETRRILDGEDVVSYLAKKMDCSTDYVEYMMERNKLLKSINITKLEQIIGFLFEKGYKPQEIRLFPRVFCTSIQTLKQRFKEFEKVKSTLPTISQLSFSSKNFVKCLENSKVEKESHTLF